MEALKQPPGKLENAKWTAESAAYCLFSTVVYPSNTHISFILPQLQPMHCPNGHGNSVAPK